VVARSHLEQQEGEPVQHQLAFLEFTTGTPHPLSPTHTVLLPLLPTVFDDVFVGDNLLGDDGEYILVSAWKSSDVVVFYSVAWKTGIVTFLRELPDMRQGSRSSFMAIDSNLIALTREELNRIEVYRLEICPSASVPLLQTVCFLELPPVTSNTAVGLICKDMEWVPTSRHYKRSRSSRRYHIPFYSSTVGTIGLLLHYRVERRGSFKCTMAISIAGLHSVIRTGVHNIPWVNWGPSITRFSHDDMFVTIGPTFGPFWIVGRSPLTVRDFGPICMGNIGSMAEDMSSWQSQPWPVVSSTKVCGFWEGDQAETHLPYRDIVVKDLHLNDYDFVVADREWIVCIGSGGPKRSSVTVYQLDFALA